METMHFLAHSPLLFLFWGYKRASWLLALYSEGSLLVVLRGTIWGIGTELWSVVCKTIPSLLCYCSSLHPITVGCCPQPGLYSQASSSSRKPVCFAGGPESLYPEVSPTSGGFGTPQECQMK